MTDEEFREDLKQNLKGSLNMDNVCDEAYIIAEEILALESDVSRLWIAKMCHSVLMSD